jgi:hypothetical protein
MNIKRLVVGQDVRLISGTYGKIAGSSKSHHQRIVKLALAEGPIRPEDSELIRFDANGKACDSRDIYKGNMEWNGIPGT